MITLTSSLEPVGSLYVNTFFHIWMSKGQYNTIKMDHQNGLSNRFLGWAGPTLFFPGWALAHLAHPVPAPLPVGTSQRMKTLTTLSSVNVSGTTVPLTTQFKLLASLSIRLFLSTHKSQLSLNPFPITFVPSAKSDQFWVKTQPISSPALLSLPGWTMQMHVYLASLSKIYLAYR